MRKRPDWERKKREYYRLTFSTAQWMDGAHGSIFCPPASHVFSSGLLSFVTEQIHILFPLRPYLLQVFPPSSPLSFRLSFPHIPFLYPAFSSLQLIFLLLFPSPQPSIFSPLSSSLHGCPSYTLPISLPQALSSYIVLTLFNTLFFSLYSPPSYHLPFLHYTSSYLTGCNLFNLFL